VFRLDTGGCGVLHGRIVGFTIPACVWDVVVWWSTCVEGSARGGSEKVLQLVALRVWVVGLGLVSASGGVCLSGMLWFPLWCAYVSLCLGGLVCGSCVICGFCVSFVWLRPAVMWSRSTLCEVLLEKASTIQQSW
jgi:hypothetical protein